MFLSASKALTETFNFKNRYVPTIIVLGLLFISIVYLYLNLIRAIEIVTSLAYSISVIVFQVCLPMFALLATLKLKGKHKVKLWQVYSQNVVKYQLTNIAPNKKFNGLKFRFNKGGKPPPKAILYVSFLFIKSSSTINASKSKASSWLSNILIILLLKESNPYFFTAYWNGVFGL